MKTERPLLATLLLTTLPLTALVVATLVGGGSRAEPPAAAITQGPRLLPPAENGVGRLVTNLGFTDIAGRKQSLSGTKARRVTVVAFTSSSCPVSKKFAPALSRLEAEYKSRGVDFIFVDPIASDTVADLKKMATMQRFQGPVVRDTRGEWTRALRARVTTDVFVLDSARTILYRGAVSDQYGLGYARDTAAHDYLRDALDAVIADGSPIIAATEAPGCALAVPTAKTGPAPITYYARISRLMQTHCVECHHSGGTAPFPLDTLESVRAHAAAIQQSVERRAMPPWSAAPPKEGHAALWVNDRSLPKQDRSDLLTWLNGSKPLGNSADAPRPRSFASGWKIGKPQALFQLPQPVSVKADGVMPYVNIDIPTNFKEDKWVNGLEIQPTDRGVVHHVLVFAQVPDASGKITHDEAAEGLNGFLAAYVPGNSTFLYEKGFAKKIPAGSTLRFQIHYTPNGTATTDQTRLGLTFASAPPQHEVRTAGIANVLLNIPAGSTNHPEKGLLPVPVEAKILAFMPHMHVRGKACRYDVVSPTGTRQTLLDIPQYDFNWQHYYRYASPVTVAKGSSIEFTGWYDNSAANPANPDPKKNVRWGPQTTDEMLLGYVEYYVEGNGEQQIITSIISSLGGIEGIAALFRQADKNNDGKVSRDELPRRALFDRLDTDHDGFVTMDEIKALAAGAGTTQAPVQQSKH